MRTFERRERYPISRENELATFQGELEYYRTNNCFPVDIFGQRIVNIYKNINLQVVVGKQCNYSCSFCIENDQISSGVTKIPNGIFAEIFGDLIRAYRGQGVLPWISITGGEPTLFPERLALIYRALNDWGIAERANVNTNGINLKCLEPMKGIRINLSRHHYCEGKSEEIFGGRCSNYDIGESTVLQCVMMKGYIDSVAEIKRYMDFYGGIGAKGFSFRGLSTLDAGKQYEKEVNYSAAKAIDFFAIVNEVTNDPDFEFLQQKIGDHYWFEIYKYKGKIVRFTYSTFEFLRQVETEERKNGQWFSRATILRETGKVYAGWTYDINEIVPTR